ncbi:hypothetical protein KM043_015842 [Ampulex compressa]|nr:hypothetical protein KM043_015842 [Ampulex compressa]
MGEDQRQPILRSINNIHRSFVRFINKTSHNVTLYWIDYQGLAVKYGVLSPNDYMDIDTFVTHPWIFVDKETGDRYMVNQRDVFFPEPWFAKYLGMRLNQRALRIERTYNYITMPVYTLRELSLRAIKRCLRNDKQPFLLDIPRSLQHELARMLRGRQGTEDRSS